MAGILYLVATPIGNYDDMTLRALRVLKEADIIICEERREGLRLLRHFGIEKEVEELNEHNEREAVEPIIEQLRSGKSVALISDAGTPVFADPGFSLVRRTLKENIKVVPIPGASSLLPALVASGFGIDRFVFQGFLSPKREERISELRELKKEKRTIVVLDTPYRLLPLLRDIAEVFGDDRRLCVAFDISMESEQYVYGTPRELYEQFSTLNQKREFVIVIEECR